VSNGDLFVANGAGNSLTELNASTGALVRVVSGPAHQFDHPDSMVAGGSDLFVANGYGTGGGSLTEVDASTGALVRVVSGSAYHFEEPGALALAGNTCSLRTMAGTRSPSSTLQQERW
jgi:hypothetical protein